MRGLFYKLHRWVAVSVGVILLIWVTTGIVLTLPPPSAGPGRARLPAPVDCRTLGVSPAAAVAAVRRSFCRAFVEVTAVTLTRVRDAVAYRVSLASGESSLINAQSGQQVMITLALAREIALDEFAGGPMRSVTLLVHHDLGYPWGPLPAYRVVFDDAHGTISYVSTGDGSVSRGNRWTRARAAFVSFHELTPIEVVLKASKLRKALMLGFALVALATVATGYTLAFQRRWRLPAVPTEARK